MSEIGLDLIDTEFDDEAVQPTARRFWHRVQDDVTDRLSQAEGYLFPWAVLLMAYGAGVWLLWPGPTLGLTAAAAMTGLAAIFAMWRAPGLISRALAAGIVAFSLGAVVAELRSALVAGPILTYRYYGPIEGRVIDIDRSASNQLRLTLDEVRLDRVAPEKTPRQIRISLHAEQPHLTLTAGLRVMTTGHLAPPEGPTEPGGFDFQRFAWFKGLGGLGYSRTPLLIAAEAGQFDALVTRLRLTLSQGVTRAIPGEAGALASAMMTGDRSAMGEEAVQALRDSNLYHLVSISGVHMSLLTGFVFLGLRGGIALVPPLALRVAGHKIAAVVALGVAGFYLMLAGGDVATTRAFVMVAVMLVAVLCDRRALSLRSVAIAGAVLILWQPEAVGDPGFQMSFAATAALIAGLKACAPWLAPGRMVFWLSMPLGMVAASALAGFASAPFAAYHFNRYSDFGLIANLLASPLMGVLVMPAGALAALLAPFGLAALPLWVLGIGCEVILQIANMVAGWEGSVTLLPRPPPWLLSILSLGFAALVLGGWMIRGAGVVLLLSAAVIWAGAERPGLLISSDGGLVGMLGPEGRVLSRDKGAGFTARSWLASDGDDATQETAAARPGFMASKRQKSFTFHGVKGVHLIGKGAGERVVAACTEADFVILAEPAAERPAGCLILDGPSLKRSGAVEIRPDLSILPSRAMGRPWGR